MKLSTPMKGGLNATRAAFRAKLDRDKGKRLFIHCVQHAAKVSSTEAIPPGLLLTMTSQLPLLELKFPHIKKLWDDVPSIVEFMRAFVAEYDRKTAE